jgi:hypothetical protein
MKPGTIFNISVQKYFFLVFSYLCRVPWYFRYQRTSFTVMDVAYVGLVVWRISITVINVDAAIPIC